MKLEIDEHAVSNCCRESFVVNVTYKCDKCQKDCVLYVEGEDTPSGAETYMSYAEKGKVKEEQAIFDYLDGFFAWDSGAKDSGIHDPVARRAVGRHLHNLKDTGVSALMARYVRQYFVSEEAMAHGYGYNDVEAFVDWFDSFMNEVHYADCTDKEMDPTPARVYKFNSKRGLE